MYLTHFILFLIKANQNQNQTAKHKSRYLLLSIVFLLKLREERHEGDAFILKYVDDGQSRQLR